MNSSLGSAISHLDRLKGRTAIVTGGGGAPSGVNIGKAIALLFAGEGARLCVVDRDLERADHTCALIVREGGQAISVAADVSSDIDCGNVLSIARQRFGEIDILVNNVGISKGGALEDFDEVSWMRIIEVNLKGALLMVRHAIPSMTVAGGGAIVNIASITALVSSGSGHFAYGPSKAALLALTRDIAVRYGRANIRTNTIAPGYVHTPLVANSVEGLSEPMRDLRRKVAPLGIEGDAWDVAQAALFLASDEARFITGVCLPVDGGATSISPLKAVEFAGE